MKVSLKDFEHIAILNTAFLGDVAVSLPLVSQIKHLSPSSLISFITTPAAVSIAELSNDVDNIIIFDKKCRHKSISGLRELAGEIKRSGVDCIVSTHKSARSSILTALSRPAFSVGFNNSQLSFLYKKRAKYQFHLHEYDRISQLLSVFDVNENESVPVDLKFDFKTITRVENLLSSSLKIKPILLIAPGSVWETKKWLPEYFIQTAASLNENYNVLIIGGNEDTDLGKFIAGQSGAQSFCGEMSIQETVYLMTKSELLITNDSAPTHFANLAGCPVATIYGPTAPIFGFYPRNIMDISIQMENMTCRPCAIHGGQTCPLGTHDCMKKLTPEFIINSLRSGGLIKRLPD